MKYVTLLTLVIGCGFDSGVRGSLPSEDEGSTGGTGAVVYTAGVGGSGVNTSGHGGSAGSVNTSGSGGRVETPAAGSGGLAGEPSVAGGSSGAGGTPGSAGADVAEAGMGGEPTEDPEVDAGTSGAAGGPPLPRCGDNACDEEEHDQTIMLRGLKFGSLGDPDAVCSEDCGRPSSCADAWLSAKSGNDPQLDLYGSLNQLIVSGNTYICIQARGCHWDDRRDGWVRVTCEDDCARCSQL